MEKTNVNSEASAILSPRLQVSKSPHLKDKESTTTVMLDVIIALLPALIGSVYFFKMKALILIAISVVSCVGFELLSQKIMKKPVRISDLSAVVTGLLLAFNLPASSPIWLPVFGAFFAIVIIKEVFGGIGNNFINPALGARAILMASWGAEMTNYINPDGMSTATPLQIIKSGSASLPSLQRMAIGDVAGVLGETSAVLLILGGIYLLVRKVINWRIPAIYIGSTAIMLVALGIDFSLLPAELLSGGLMLGAFFMATDYVTCPVTNKGKVVFALGCGIITAIIRVLGNMPEGVSYAILIMNTSTPLIDKFTKTKLFGEVKN
ncbi:MAG: RnfABCDGE type electron transport complex subunit D [Tissierellia bacterium]|nr:RnfABCDGE type electron transport complex subunit D [Tissierellia bacterium]